MANVALFIFGINDLKGGGGAERFFADFFDIYNKEQQKHRLFYIIDELSINNLKRVNKLKCTNNLLQFKIISNRFKSILEFLQIVKFILINRIKLIHIPLYSISYVPLIKKLNGLPGIIRPKIVINIVNCYAPIALADSEHPQHKGMTATYEPLFSKVKIDGYFCWNQNFVDYYSKLNIRHKTKKLFAIKSRFSDTGKFKPEQKSNTIVFASRLDVQKRPDWFIKAIGILKQNHVEAINNWKFIISGEGPLKEQLLNDSKLVGLENILEFKTEGELWRLLNYSKVYVSCQDYENFPSLAMAEAMASGNAIITRGVGQTELFVKNNVNGLIVKKDSPEGLAESILEYISHPSLHNLYMNESLRLIKEVHNPDNFIAQIDKFWSEVIDG
ncbi:MAG: glycosyltransferase [Bacteroidetes bacterium]|nr:glycosyltransferase [Bacteroidota bacterium]